MLTLCLHHPVLPAAARRPRSHVNRSSFILPWELNTLYLPTGSAISDSRLLCIPPSLILFFTVS